MKFAKLFETEEHGQILIKLDSSQDEACPEVRAYFSPPDLGVCSLAGQWPDTDRGWDAAEAKFKSVDEAAAISMIKPGWDAAVGMGLNDDQFP